MNAQKKILVVSFQSLTQRSAGGMARLGFFLSRKLHQRGMLKYFVVFSKGKFETNFPSRPVSAFSRYILFILNKVNKYLKLPDHKFRLVQEHLYDMLCKAHITRDISILFTTNAHMKRTFAKAKKMGIKIFYVPANSEENYICDLVTKENKKLGITEYEPYTYPPRLKLYNDSVQYIDKVICTYPPVYESYELSGRLHELVRITGHLKPDFPDYEYLPKQHTDTFKVIYIATTVPLKGLQYLLEAWEMLMAETENRHFQLYVIGRIEAAIKHYIQKRFAGLKNVSYMGKVNNVHDYLADKDICVVPSLVDAGPYVALEAAHYGVPVVITESCGSAELLSSSSKGCITIPVCDAKSIKESIQWIYRNPGEAQQIGINGKNNLDRYNVDDLVTRIADHLEQSLKEKLHTHE